MVPRLGSPSRANRIRSIEYASVAVPTVDLELPPIRCWSTMIAADRLARLSTSGRPYEGRNDCTKAV